MPRRVLAVLILSSTGVAGGAAAASATTGVGTTAKAEDTFVGRCVNARVPGELFRMKADLEGDGSGPWARNVNSVKVVAVDNQGEGPWYDPEAHVKSMQVTYLDARDREVYDDLLTGPAAMHGGRHLFLGDRDAVRVIRVRVWWKQFADEGSEYLHCQFSLTKA